MKKRLLLTGTWLGAAALVVLAARSLAYALAEPAPLRSGLQHAAGGSRLVIVALVALGVCGALATAVVWLAALGVRERAALTPGRFEPPRLRPLRLLAHGLALSTVSCLAFAALESYLHMRAGFAWHGLACLTGPVHVNAIPILVGLSALAAAVIDAAGHVLRWLRRTIALLLQRPPRLAAPVVLVPFVQLVFPAAFRAPAALPRAPPLPVG